MIPAGIISADGHVCEPANCYVDHIDPKYRDAGAVHHRRSTTAPTRSSCPACSKPVALGFIDGAGFTPTERDARAPRR